VRLSAALHGVLPVCPYAIPTYRDLPASVEARTGGNYVDLRLLHKRKSQADVIELKPSEKEEDMENDASKAPEF
jgi:hypothetical protein